MVDTTWLLWSLLLAITCWSSLALSHYRLRIAITCLFISCLIPKISPLLQKKDRMEIVAIPPYQFLTIATHKDCITYISQSSTNTPHHTWQRWLSSVTCKPTILILAQQDLWRESHAIRLHTNPRLTAVYSPKKTFSTQPCEFSKKSSPRLICKVVANDCQCKWEAAKTTLSIEPENVKIHKASSPSAISIQATALPHEITLTDHI